MRRQGSSRWRPPISSGSQTFSSAVRAITPGRFTVPPAYAEAMYDPDIHASAYEDRYLVVSPNPGK